jgi:hypothetical protein
MSRTPINVVTNYYCELGDQSQPKMARAVGGGVGKIVHFGKLPVNMYAQLFRNVERPYGTTHWSARLQAQLLFPKKRKE